jgi:hypothetical protein
VKPSKEKNAKKIVCPNASVLFLMAVAAAILSPMLLLPVSAQEVEEPGNSEGHGTPRTDPGQPDDPDCWGEANSDLAQDDFGDPGVGQHASDPIPGDDDKETPRAGVGNQAEDTPPEHGAVVGPLFGQPCENPENDP